MYTTITEFQNMKAKLTQQKRKTSKSTYAAGELNISFSVTDRTTKYKINS